MLHIYRQITSLHRVRPVVIAQKLENKERFPLRDIYVIRKPTFHFLRRLWFKQIADRPWQISPAEVRAVKQVLNETKAQLLHIYFGHIAVLLRPLIRQWQKPSLVSFHGADVLVDMQKPAYRHATEEMLSLVRRVLVRSDSLRQAVIDLGCAPGKIEIQRAGMEIRKAFPIPCWKRWQADCRSSRPAMAEFPKQSKTRLAVFW